MFKIRQELLLRAFLEKSIPANTKEQALEAFDDFADKADESCFELLMGHADWLGKPSIKDLGEYVELHEKQGRLKF
jgi:succinate dehydrogenase flavin-adding protein (antitoxin of CptAB toxin-antitoxin module)